MKSSEEDSLVLVFKPNLNLQGSWKMEFQDFSSNSNCGMENEKLVVLHPPKTVPPFSRTFVHFRERYFFKKVPTYEL